MSAIEVAAPAFAVRCDTVGCPAEYRLPADRPSRFNERTENLIRWAARADGWTVRPAGGKGSRSAPDYCPACVAVRAEVAR